MNNKKKKLGTSVISLRVCYLYNGKVCITAKKVIQTYNQYIDMHLYILIVFGFKHTNFRSHLFGVRTPCICMLLSAFFEQAQNICCTTCYRKKGKGKKTQNQTQHQK